MKKPVTEDRVFCDFCEQAAQVKCLVCGKDLCSHHMLSLTLKGPNHYNPFHAYLCPQDGRPLLSILEGYRGRSTWENCGANAESNEARLKENIGLLEV